MAQKTMPRNIEAERALLGAMLIDPDCYYTHVSLVVGVSDLYQQKNRWVFQALINLYHSRTQVDYLTVCEEIERMGHLKEIGGAAYITQLIQSCPSSLGAKEYAAIVALKASLRRQITVHQQAVVKAFEFEGEDSDELISTAVRQLVGISRGENEIDMWDVLDALDDVEAEQRALEKGIPPKGFDPMLPRLREGLKFGLFYPGSVTLVGANPGLAKTMFLLGCAAHNVVFRGLRGLFVGTEMQKAILGRRLAPILARQMEVLGLTSSSIDRGQAAGPTAELRERLAAEVGGRRLVLIDRSFAIERLPLILQREEMRGDPFDFVVLDYVQGMKSDQKFRATIDRMDYISETVRDVSRDNNVVCVCASTFTKGAQTEPPTQERFRQTFQFAHDAANLIGIWRTMTGSLAFRPVKIREPRAGVDILQEDILVAINRETGIISQKADEMIPIAF